MGNTNPDVQRFADRLRSLEALRVALEGLQKAVSDQGGVEAAAGRLATIPRSGLVINLLLAFSLAGRTADDMATMAEHIAKELT